MISIRNASRSHRNLNLDHHPLSKLCDLTELFEQTHQRTDMAEFTHSGGGDNHGFPDNPEHNTPIPSLAAMPETDGGQPSSGARGFRAWVGKKYDKGKAKVERGVHKADKRVKSLLDRGKPKNSEGEGEAGPQDAGGSSRVQATAMGTIKTALGIAVTLVPDPFKGPAQALLKVMDAIEVRVTCTFVPRMPLKCCIES